MVKSVYPFMKLNYDVEIDGIGAMRFSELSGGEVSYETIEYHEGYLATSSVKKSQGFMKFGNITLKYGFTENKELYDWLRQALNQTVEKRDVKISLLGDDHKSVKASWILTNAIPCKIQLSDFSISENEFAIEKLELSCESIVRDFEN